MFLKYQYPVKTPECARVILLLSVLNVKLRKAAFIGVNIAHQLTICSWRIVKHHVAICTLCTLVSCFYQFFSRSVL